MRSRAQPSRYWHCGPSGAGDFVKMDHYGIEYGLMTAYAESLQCRDRTVCATSSIINTISILAMSQTYGGAEVLPLPGCWISTSVSAPRRLVAIEVRRK